MNSLQKIADYQIETDKSIIDYLYYNGRSYWWAINLPINSQLTRYNQSSSQLHSLINQTYHIINTSVPITDIMQFCFAKLFSMRYNKKKYNHNSAIPTIALRQVLDREWKLKIDVNNNEYLENIYHHSVIEKLGDSVRIISPYTNSLGPDIFEVLSKFKKILVFERDNVESSLYYKYWTLSVWRETYKAHLHFKNVWRLLKTKKKWFDFISETYNVPCTAVYRLLRTFIVYIIPELIKYMKLTESLVQKEHVMLLHMTDEFCDGRTFVSVGKNLGIPTIAIQHGVIFNHPGYLSHSARDVSRIKKGIDTSIPLADITCVWGEGEQELLYKNGHYPEGSVIVTGNPRYDYLNHAHELYSRDAVCKRFGIDSTLKIVLWTTQCHGNSIDENQRYFMEVLNVIKSLDDIILIIKQHPLENDEYTKLIQQYLAESQLGNKVIFPDKNSDTTELVYISDVVINKYSTTGQEAVAFHKPMIILDFTDQPDYYGGYVREGVADASFEEGSLKPILMNILEHGFHKEENQEIFIRKHMYKIDGCAAKRVADVVLGQIEKVM